MSGEVTTPSTPVVTPPAPAATVIPPPTPPVQPPAGHEFQAMTPEQFSARLREERAAARREQLKEIGVEKVEDAKSRLDALKARENAELSESQRLAKELEGLKPAAQRTAALEETVKRFADSEMALLSDNGRKYVEGIAGDDHGRRLEAIAKARETGIYASMIPPAAATPPPAATTATTPAATPKPATTIAQPGPRTPQPAGTLNLLQQYEAMPSGTAKAVFKRKNYAELVRLENARKGITQ